MKPTTKKLLVYAATLLPVGIFLAIASQVISKHPLPFDVALLEKLHTFANPLLDTLFVAITNIGGINSVIIVTLILSVLYFIRRRPQHMYFLLLSIGGASVANVILKAIFHRDRPALWQQIVSEHDFSFPSGHAMASMALVACLVIIYWNTAKRWLVVTLGGIVVILIGLSRLYLGVHYPSDIIAGWSVSIVIVVVAFFASKLVVKWFPQNRQTTE